MWRASAFEDRHPVLVHQILLSVSVLTYLTDPEDVVWRYIKHASEARMLEHLCFGAAAVAVGAGAWLCTWAMAKGFSSENTYPRPSRMRDTGEILHAIGLGSLLPLAGFLVLVGGETIRIGRRESLRIHNAQQCDVSTSEWQEEKAAELQTLPSHSLPTRSSAWRQAARIHVGAWFAFLSMIVFSATLIDRLAEILFAATLLVSLLVHWTSYRRALAAGASFRHMRK
jgi:hypothetical protein